MIDHGRGVNLRTIRRTLHRSASTITREVERNRALHVALALQRSFVYNATSASGPIDHDVETARVRASLRKARRCSSTSTTA